MEWMGAFNFFHQLANLGQHISTSVYLCLLKKPLFFKGLEFEKELIERVVAGRRAVACLVNHVALQRREDGSKNALGLESLWDCNSGALLNSW